MNILALEISTSSAKAMIYSAGEGIVGSNTVPFDRAVGDVASQNPEGVYRTVLMCTGELMDGVDRDIDAIGLASTWHSFLLLDERRRPISDILSWANTDAPSRTAGQYRQDEGLNNWFYKKTGCPIHSMYPLWKWIHFLEEGELDDPGRVYISSKPEYIFERLTGEIGVSRSIASGTGFMNIHSLRWDEEILDYAGVRKEQLSPLKGYDFYAPLLAGEARRLGLKEGIPVFITGPDGALNQIGSGALAKGIMTLSVGTSGALRMASPEPVVPDNPSTWCYYVAEGKRLAGAATSGACNCVEWFRGTVPGEDMGFDELQEMAGEVDPREAPFFLPFLYGERCPGWQDGRAGGFLGLRGYHSTGYLYYSVLEGILFNLFQSYKILIEVGDVPKEIRISGGINNSDFWLQMAADIFQRKLGISVIKNASTMGAVAIVLKSMGEIERLEDFKSELGGVISPRPEMDPLYRERFDRYIEWYQKTS